MGATTNPRVPLPTSTPSGLTVRSIFIPDSDEWFSAVAGALSWILNSQFWEGRPDEQEDTVNRAEIIFKSFREGGYMIGSIVPYVTSVLPSNVLYCDGSFYNRSDYPELSAVIDPLYAGYDPDTFQVPNFRGRFLFGDGEVTSVGSSIFGDSLGNDGITLSTAQLPSHSHGLSPHTHAEGTAAPTLIAIGPGAPAASAVPALGTTGLGGGGSTGTAGTGAVIDNYPPYSVIKWGIIAR